MGRLLGRSEGQDNRKNAGEMTEFNSPLRLVVCINERLGAGQRSCVGSGNLDYIAEIKSLIEADDLPIPVIERECLGKCGFGPIMRIAPSGEIFTEVNSDTLDEIMLELKRLLLE